MYKYEDDDYKLTIADYIEDLLDDFDTVSEYYFLFEIIPQEDKTYKLRISVMDEVDRPIVESKKAYKSLRTLSDFIIQNQLLQTKTEEEFYKKPGLVKL